VAAVADPQQQLSWEARQRKPAAIAALIAAVCILGGEIWGSSIYSDFPRAPFIEALGNAALPGPIGEAPSLRLEGLEWLEDHFGVLMGSSIVRAIGWLGLGWALTFLAAATRARRPEFPKIAIYVPLLGAVLSALAGILGTLGTNAAVSNFLDGPRTVDAARDIGSEGLLMVAQFVGLAGQLAAATGIVLVALNAMRAGLLTRFLGILGCITGALVVITIGPVPVVQAFWMGALGLLFLGTVPGSQGVPPAWKTGQAEPWPTQQELAEARRAEQARQRGEDPDAAGEAEPVAAGTPHPASRKRKRKRRD
jgi:hypothetical protein